MTLHELKDFVCDPLALVAGILMWVGIIALIIFGVLVAIDKHKLRTRYSAGKRVRRVAP